MLYILNISTKLPKLKYSYKDGDYLKFLKNNLHPNDLEELMDTIVDKRNDMLFYKRTFTHDECLTTYIFDDNKSRTDVLNFLETFFGDKNIDTEFESIEENMTVKEYIFLK